MGPSTRLLRIGIAALVLFGLVTAGTLAIVQARDASTASPDPVSTNTPGPPTTRGMMGNGMMGRGMMGSGNLSDPYDLRFLDEMIVHHEMAIMMVRMMISQSTHPELRDLGQRIVAGQQRQIDQMTAWRQQWYPNAAPSSSMMGRGMMHGDFADRMFLTMMIPHHQRAIDLSNDVLTNAQYPDLQGLAKDIIAVQSAEITEMRGYLAAWYGITS